MEYKQVYGYEDKYVIDVLSNVYSIIGGKFEKKRTSIDKKGNLQVSLWNGKKFTYRKVSRLMVETFFNIHRPWQPIVYLDGNKLNCKLNNLTMEGTNV